VLFIDIVGYTKLLINEQLERLEKLREIARATETFSAAQREGKLMRLPTGDGVNLAQVYVWTGEKHLAVDTLAKALSVPNDCHYGEPRLHPF
jgi:hypothetical protein